MEQEFSCTLKDLMAKNCVHFTKKQRIYLKFKRCMDIFFSLTGLLLLMPILLLIAAAIKIESPSERVLYTQDRIGRRGIVFKLYKFRSMRGDAPVLSTHEFRDADKYITQVGRLLRISSMDELPQLWNVLIGNMSLVGPRPLLPRERNVHTLRFVYGLYQVRPGITGMAQTHGRDDMGDCDKVRWDREYVRRLSFTTDIRLLVRTVFKVARREGILDKNGDKSWTPKNGNGAESCEGILKTLQDQSEDGQTRSKL